MCLVLCQHDQISQDLYVRVCIGSGNAAPMRVSRARTKGGVYSVSYGVSYPPLRRVGQKGSGGIWSL